MKKILIVLSAILLIAYADAQTIGKTRVTNYLQLSAKEQPNGIVKAININTIPATGHIIYASPMVGLNPVIVEKINGTWETTAAINPLFAYGIGFGEYKKNSAGDLEVQPYIGFNAFVSGGVIPSATLKGSFQAGGLLTVYKYFGIGGGYSAVTNSPFVCTTLKFDLFSFKSGFGASILKVYK